MYGSGPDELDRVAAVVRDGSAGHLLGLLGDEIAGREFTGVARDVPVEFEVRVKSTDFRPVKLEVRSWVGGSAWVSSLSVAVPLEPGGVGGEWVGVHPRSSGA